MVHPTHSDLEGPMAAAVNRALPSFTIPFTAGRVRSDGGRGAGAEAVHTAVRSLNPQLPAGHAESIERVLERTTGQLRFSALLIMSFGAMALVRVGVGLCGLISYTITPWRSGYPRLACASRSARVPLRWAASSCGRASHSRPPAVGLALAGALAATRLPEGMLYSVSATDYAVYAALAAGLLLVTALDCDIPASGAMRADSITALRAD